MKIPNKGGLRTDDDLRAIIVEVLRQSQVKPTKKLVDDIFTLVIKCAANEQYQELRRIVVEAVKQLT